MIAVPFDELDPMVQDIVDHAVWSQEYYEGVIAAYAWFGAPATDITNAVSERRMSAAGAARDRMRLNLR